MEEEWCEYTFTELLQLFCLSLEEVCLRGGRLCRCFVLDVLLGLSAFLACRAGCLQGCVARATGLGGPPPSRQTSEAAEGGANKREGVFVTVGNHTSAAFTALSSVLTITIINDHDNH